MKRFLFTMAAIVSLASCSDDDSVKKSCDCTKTTARYNEDMQTYEPISAEFYSNDCKDDKPLFNPDGNGTYYNITCTQNN